MHRLGADFGSDKDTSKLNLAAWFFDLKFQQRIAQALGELQIDHAALGGTSPHPRRV
jgi:hypothetical protein